MTTVCYAEIPDEVILERMKDSPEAQEAEALLKAHRIEYQVKYLNGDPHHPSFHTYLSANPVVTARIGSFKGLEKIKKFIELEQRIRALH